MALVYKGKKIIVIIPARGGSKRIPQKNIKLLAGKPMIVYSIEQSLNSRYIDEVYVSSDDKKILEISKKFGAEIIKRPKKYATDKAKTIDVLKHTLKKIKADLIVLLQPTSPLRKVENIDKAIEIFFKKNADTVVSVTKRNLGPQWILKKQNGRVAFLFGNDFSKIRTQDQDETYEINGAVYVFLKENILNSKNYPIGKKVYPLVINKIEALEIDDREDFMLVDLILRNKKWGK